jgi:diguanylate cyclase (GGDEF)-like protein
MLVLDSDPEFLEHVSSLGRLTMIQADSFGSLEDAVAACEHTGFDAALIGVGDNAQDAFDAARALRATKENATLPVAFTSADAAVASQLAESGGLLFAAKPLELNSFADAMQRLLREGNKERARVLIVDDDPDFVELASTVLSGEGMAVVSITDPTTVMQRMAAFDPALVLLDVMMPEVNGLEACRELRRSARWQSTPVIFVTMKTDATSRLETFRAGGDDYLAKPVLAQELIARVRIRVERAALLRALSDREPLSGLLLRRAFFPQAEARVAEVQRLGGEFSLVILDLDRFKEINETHGYLAGDEIIASFGTLLRQSFGDSALHSRWGGVEFVVALPGVGNEAAKAAVSRVVDAFVATRYGEGEGFGATFTAGVASLPSDGESLTELIRVGGQRLYAGKSAGRASIFGDGD